MSDTLFLIGSFRIPIEQGVLYNAPFQGLIGFITGGVSAERTFLPIPQLRHYGRPRLGTRTFSFLRRLAGQARPGAVSSMVQGRGE